MINAPCRAHVTENLVPSPCYYLGKLGPFRRWNLAEGSTSLGAGFEDFSLVPHSHFLSFLCLDFSVIGQFSAPDTVLCLSHQMDSAPLFCKLKQTLP